MSSSSSELVFSRLLPGWTLSGAGCALAGVDSETGNHGGTGSFSHLNMPVKLYFDEQKMRKVICLAST